MPDAANWSRMALASCPAGPAWAPLSGHHNSWSGIDATGDWALKLRLTARDSSIEPLIQRAYVIVTLESPDESLEVYNDGLAAIAAFRYPSALAVDAGRLRIRSHP
jgi:hypothetical protein